ncbi:MAG: SAM-dependent methyltransferase [Limnohabitans sp.]|nr:SAM-dependent methyltransferase [Limnohabitans sp.]
MNYPSNMKKNKTTSTTNSLADLQLREGQSIDLLKSLHILTMDGKINQDSRRKLKQVMHLFQLIESPLMQLIQSQSKDGENTPITLADHGAGKSYLGFILYDLFFKPRFDKAEIPFFGHIYGIETRESLVESSQLLAQQLDFEHMSFLNLTAAQSIQDPSLPSHVDLVTALHACDTATDDAISFALHKKAQLIALVPCCQAEMAAQLRHNKAFDLSRMPLSELWRHPLHTREMGSQVTNVLRCLYLEAMGYQVTVTELVGWEHSLKNEMILARNIHQKKRSAAERLQALLQEFGVVEWGAKRFALN